MHTRSLLLSTSVLALTTGLLFACGDKDDDDGGDDDTGSDTTDTDTTDTDTDTDTTGPVDADGDGYDDTVDCDDGNADIHPDAAEVCDDIDNDCDDLVDDDDDSLDTSTATTFYMDGDDDGFGDAKGTVVACAAPDGYADNADDCDDVADTVYPGADEFCDDGIDQDCDTVLDCDDDSCGGDAACAATVGGVSPSVGVVGHDTDLTITGSGFAWATAGATTVTVGDADCADVVVVDDSTITCTVPGADEAGTVDVTVSNDNGDASLTGGFSWQQCIYGAQGAGAVAGSLYCINPLAGTVTEIGEIGYAVTGLAAGPDGVLYATQATAFSSDAHLLTIDLVTGAGTIVGPLDDVADGENHQAMPDLAFAGSTLVGWTENGDDVTTIDTTTGAVTSTEAGTSSYNTGMASDSAGNVYVMPRGFYDDAPVYLVDVSTGGVTSVGAISGSGVTTPARASGAYFSGTFYVMSCVSTADGECELYSVDTSTGLATLVDVDLPAGLESITAFLD